MVAASWVAAQLVLLPCGVTMGVHQGEGKTAIPGVRRAFKGGCRQGTRDELDAAGCLAILLALKHQLRCA